MYAYIIIGAITFLLFYIHDFVDHGEPTAVEIVEDIGLGVFWPVPALVVLVLIARMALALVFLPKTP